MRQSNGKAFRPFWFNVLQSSSQESPNTYFSLGPERLLKRHFFYLSSEACQSWTLSDFWGDRFWFKHGPRPAKSRVRVPCKKGVLFKQRKWSGFVVRFCYCLCIYMGEEKASLRSTYCIDHCKLSLGQESSKIGGSTISIRLFPCCTLNQPCH